uniref:Heat shock 70 kDa protein 14 n=1 Tax=Gadus morhua TaxID=8049 RepID=A0A8C5FGZ5_GADMO
MAAIGVHFGYTCACVAIFKDGRADVIANDAGDRVTPSVVAYRETEQIVGIAAKQGRVRNATNTVVKVKQLLGRTSVDPEANAHKAESKCPVVSKGEKLYYEITAGEQTKLVTPDAVAKLVLEKMRETAQAALGSDVTDAVITVPFEFSQAQKTALREAAEAAGFNVLRLIHEPSAALLVVSAILGRYIKDHIHLIFPHDPLAARPFSSHVLVYKLGGTSLSVTALQVNGGMFRVLDTLTDHSVGGESYTDALALHLAAEFKRSFKQDISNNARAMMKLTNGADHAKHSLSSLTSANCFVDSLHDGMDFDCNISSRHVYACAVAFNASAVVLCGGSARIPRLQKMIQDLFPDVEQLCSTPPDEVIAMGAALEAGLLAGKDGPCPDDESVAVEVCSADILVKEQDESGAEVFNVLLPSGTPLPARRVHTLQGPGALASLCVELYQRVALQPQTLARIVLRDLEPKEENHDIDTVLTMKRDGSLHVSCVDQSSGRSEVVTIAAAS